MKFYQLTIAPTVNQAALIQALQKLGGETIQTSNGLFAASEASEAEVREAAAGAASGDDGASGAGVSIASVDASGDLSALSKDAQTLVEKYRH